MDKNKITLVTGADGLVGKNFRHKFVNAIYVNRNECDLRNYDEVDSMMKKYKPNHVIHLAGMVGGVGANMLRPVEFFENNILINTVLLKYAHKYNVEKLVAFMSTCIFPDDVIYPLSPSKIHLGEPHISNFGYAYSKRMVDVQLKAYQMQYNKKWFSVIPTNIYGPHDNFDIKDGHVIPALIHKCYLAKQNNTPWVIWGSGEPVREFIYVDDIVNLTEKLLSDYSQTKPIILSTSQQIKIKTIVKIIAKHMKFQGDIIFDTSKPEGQLRKPSDTSDLKEIFNDYVFVSIEDGIKKTVDWFLTNYETIRR